MTPLRGYSPNIRAGVVAIVSTQRCERQLAVDDALVEQVHPVLDAADAVGDLGEVADAQLLLLLHAERAVVGGHDRQVVRAQPLPQVALVRLVLAAQRRRAHPLRALEARRAELVFERQVEVLRAGLGEHVAAARRAPRRPPRAPATRTGARCRAGSRWPPRRARSPGWWPPPPAPAAGSGRGRSGRSRRGRAPGATSTSIAVPFSACIMIIAPLSRAFCIARRIWPSSL